MNSTRLNPKNPFGFGCSIPSTKSRPDSPPWEKVFGSARRDYFRQAELLHANVTNLLAGQVSLLCHVPHSLQLQTIRIPLRETTCRISRAMPKVSLFLLRSNASDTSPPWLYICTEMCVWWVRVRRGLNSCQKFYFWKKTERIW